MPNSNLRIAGPVFIEAGRFWLNLSHIVSIYINNIDQTIAIEMISKTVIRLNRDESTQFKKSFDSITKEYSAP